ncbi:polyribonucleotide nucleotidyltransferase [Bifidobacterium sp. ESL0690]|uniref:polyribonucleotide nucleotidyltransferase n=1 Tax=Bifidobacterium sp. ESL0690 TaxID=2983214 RepID=UPI0023F62AD6|nr:polyribonucleotide nucleotidyltransferase [Bifidobacterium sp. ESL0690]WEV46416.1 polyribonucleotide nucleotidyltransferase [Bifidobacterium sp. ESL0690]
MEGPEIKAVEAVIDNGSFGKRTLRFETGRLAQQADGAVAAYLDDDSMVLSTTTAGSSPKENYDFFPLTVDVEEKMYAAGKIPGSFFRREGRPSNDAILACRIIDRPLRPLFPHTLRNEVQVVETVLACNPDDAYDMIALNAASASTMISGLPFEGPVSGVRLALVDGQWVAFPRWSERDRAVFEIVVAGRVIENGDVAIAMIEAGAGKNAWNLIYDEGQQKPDEEVVAGGLEAAKPFIKVICEAQNELKEKAGKTNDKEFQLFPEYTDELYKRIDEIAHDDLNDALSIAAKLPRQERIHEIKEDVRAKLADEFTDMDDAEKEKELGNAFKELQRQIVRRRVLTEDFRIDGRGLRDIRTLSAEVGIVPRVHGSALFQRGETQILGVTTLNMLKMEQTLDSISGPQTKRYMHNYEMPPYSTGETGRVGSPKRREVGHGALAEKALVPVLPSKEDFPYAIRQVSEAIGSNGSTSMGSVCASTLSLLDAGVPLKAPVAGIAMGLISGDVDGKHIYKTLTDILGAEDAFGDMDFKVAGTSEFITALQLDTKLDGIPADVLAAALQQAKEARTTILEVINECIDAPAEMSPYAPRIITTSVPVDKIGEIIGPKGKMINQIQEETGADVSVEDDGTIYIASEGGDGAEKAKATIDAIAHPHVPAVGENFNGKVVKTTSFGAFVNLTPGTDGLLHISQIRNLTNGERIDAVEDVLKEGDTVEVTVQGVDDRGKISLAIPGFEDQESGPRGGGRGGRRDHDDRGGRGYRGHGRDREDRDDRRRRDDRDDRDDRRSSRGRDDRSEREDVEFEDRPRRRREDRDDRDDRRRSDRDDRRGHDREDRAERDDNDDFEDRPRRRREDRDDYRRSDRHEGRRGGGYRGGRRNDRNPRYATDDHYDEYREDREERSERPRRRVRRDFDPFDD